MISKLLTVALLLIAGPVHSSELHLTLLEKKTSATVAYSLESTTLAFRKIETADGAELPQIQKYKVSARKLANNAIALADADEILYQCKIGEIDLIVVRVENNSFSNPMKLLSALSGHPVQVSRIVILTIDNDRVISEKEVTSRDSSYGWAAKVLRP